MLMVQSVSSFSLEVDELHSWLIWEKHNVYFYYSFYVNSQEFRYFAFMKKKVDYVEAVASDRSFTEWSQASLLSIPHSMSPRTILTRALCTGEIMIA